MADGSSNGNDNDPTVAVPTIARMGDSSPPSQPQQQQRPVPPTRGTNNINLNPELDPWGALPLEGAAATAAGGGGFGVAGFDAGPANNNNNNNINWNNTNDAQAIWRERERRQRTVRFLMMFLLMLLLMDGEEQQQRERQRRSNNNGDYENNLRKGGNISNKGQRTSGDYYLLDPPLYQARRAQDELVESQLWQHPRFQHLLTRNEGKDIDLEIRQWTEQHVDLEKDEFGAVVAAPPEAVNGSGGGGGVGRESSVLASTSSSTVDARTAVDPTEEEKAWHYPWNATGFYRGDWTKDEEDGKKDTINAKTIGDDNQKNSATSATATTTASSQPEVQKETSMQHQDTSSSPVLRVINTTDMELTMMEILAQKEDPTMGVHLLPPGVELRLPNMTISRIDKEEEDGNNVPSTRIRGGANSVHKSPFLRGATSTDSSGTDDEMVGNEANSNAHREAKITLTKASGRAAFQLYSRTVPAMKELSIIDGFVKLYDSNTVGYSTRRDILLRVHGVLIHSLGRISLVANTHTAGRAALVIRGPGSSGDKGSRRPSANEALDQKSDERRRLLELLPGADGTITEERLMEIREDALRLFYDETLLDVPSKRIFSFEDDVGLLNRGILYAHDHKQERRRLDEARSIDRESTRDGEASTVVNEVTAESSSEKEAGKNPGIKSNATTGEEIVFSKYVIPYPFAWDDEGHSLQRNRIPSTARSMPPREQLLEANAGSCEFEINMIVQEEEWTIGLWRNLMIKHLNQISQLDPAKRGDQIQELDAEVETSNKNDRASKRKRKKATKPSGSKSQRVGLEQALVMTINGTISSVNCNFAANINATAIRTDWEHTTGKAINYSFYMMVTCLTQIVLLLRQLLHTQAQSAATRVSLMCIGWQTVVDALLCLVHIYLSLAMQPLFTAFASVAFFKLLIFCVIEMKYMAIIIQARNAANGGNTIELLRRQIAMLHLRFYVALMASCLGFLYSGETYRTAYILLLYSFWVPQIIHNIVTEAKRPLHPYYVYGMSLSRLVAPIYIFAFQNNFLKEVYPESPTNVLMCQLLILWVGIQAGILEAQGRYGARFMIPARFLPPKFDYNRPIPASLLPRGVPTVNPSEELQNERASPTTEVRSLVVPKKEASPRGGGARNRMKGSRSNRGEIGMTAETITAAPKNPDLPHFDCVICYNEIDISNRTGYMLAPCDHIFHKDCLVQWMEVKMECPICRTTLPAI